MSGDDANATPRRERRDWEGRARAAEAYARHEHDRALDVEASMNRQNLLFAQAEHKVKNQLTVVAGIADMLCDSWDDFTTADRLQMLGVLRRNARGALTQAEDVLAELKSEADAVGEPVEIDLRDVLALNAGDAVSISAQHVIALDGDDGVRCWADPGALQQVVGHLLENAVKYSPTGGTITLGVRQEGRWAVIDVRDEGIGIPSSDDIFEPFKRGNDIPDTIRGSGLGLYVVRSLVDRMQGTVTAARNGDGRGSTFTVRLPAALEDGQS